MLAWAPAIDKILKDRGVAATLVVTSACPPLVGVAHDGFPACEKQNVRWVAEMRNIDAVVMAGAWDRYQDNFNGGGVRFGTETAGILLDGLPRTAAALLDQGVDVYLIGPVPRYQLSVPYMYARQAMNGQREAGGKPVSDHYSRNHEFFSVAKKLPPSVKFIDPAEWFCASSCLLGNGSDVFYRDEDHLSVFGSVFFSERLGDALEAMFGGQASSKEEG